MSVYYDLPKPVEKNECVDCGREDGHHLGCPQIGKPQPVENETALSDAVCAFEGCQDAPKPYGGKGPRPKFCAAHGK